MRHQEIGKRIYDKCLQHKINEKDISAIFWQNEAPA